ncbi:MAG TPA: ATP-binding protein [Actinomycetes bacterium]|nr:ATP-binding protein [Actinomycetes bacterium]
MSAAGRRRPMTRCGRCRERAVIELRRHNCAFCRDCFLHHARQQVRRAIDKHRMIAPEDRVLVAVSGGKDSLALWDILLGLGYHADGLYLGLGIGAYSDRSGEVCAAFAAEHGATLVTHDLAREQGFTIPQAAAAQHGRSSCSVCGLSKRYVFNSSAFARGYDVVATGHNLDDEAAVLLGNTLRWDTAAMARQFPVLEATRPGLVKKVKPLYRLAERESAAYCVLTGIDYVVEECPLVAGNTQMRYKHTLDELEEEAPGTKHGFLLGFLERAAPLLEAADDAELTACSRCGMVTQAPAEAGEAPVCAFCRTRARLTQGLVVLETAEGAR